MRRDHLMSYLCLATLAVLGLCLLPMAGAGSALGADDKPVVVLETSKGDITLELDRAKAPTTVDNFLKYVDAKFYDGTIFHRVIPDFMIQGGGMNEDMREKKTNAPIKNEGGNGLKNARGTVAMARTSDPDSATAQFFINLKDNGFLDREQARDRVGYAVFGKVTKGMDVVDAIAKVPTGNRGPHSDVPTSPVVIKRAYREKS